ncbi:virulence factor TspB C-terminal domain-related protein [Methylococcus mesophilus]|uniref:virulence factor TspB C-terminal domain-related protein n=1 Tax=Methylococcus mesophilus TaxID=2993564 RepID=UPI00224B5994|nr:virulence factor TspB C-terminal domain-related protein [Methylococcus mesophilus]UZR29441.1 virulence factor TspB C-terminal domain-related protein [Methylococcus mesophilus]
MDSRVALTCLVWGLIFVLAPARAETVDYYEPGDPGASNLLGPTSLWSKLVDGLTTTWEQSDTGSVAVDQAALGVAGAVAGSARILQAVDNEGYTGYGHKVAIPSGVEGIPPIEGEFRRLVDHATLAKTALAFMRRGNPALLLGVSAFAEWLASSDFEWDSVEESLVKVRTTPSGPPSLDKVYFCDGSNIPVSSHAASCSCSDGHVNGREASWNAGICEDDAGHQWQTRSDTARPTNCPSGYGWNDGTSRCDSLPLKEKVPDSVAIPQLASHPSSQPENILSTIALTGTLGEFYYVPKPFGKWLTDPFGQTKTQVKGKPVTTANPDGSTSTKTPTVDVEYPKGPDGKSDGKVKTKPGTQVTTCTASGSCTTTNTDYSGSDVVQCDKYPDSLGCAKLGDPGQPTQLQTKDNKDLFNPVGLGGAAGCPAPLSGSFLGQAFTISYDPVCQFASGIRFVVLAIAWVSAGWILFGTLKGA